jgi:capsular exopolysaccharide synthesis family protein
MAIVKNKKNTNAPDIRRERRNILNEKTPFSIVEEYKLLRTNIMFSLAKEGCKTVAFTSANMSEGKSISAVNTSITFAEMNQKVLLMDCDLRLPKINKLLAHAGTPGISNVIVNMSAEETVIHHVKTQNSSFDVIFAGDVPPNPSELLGSERFAKMLSILSEHYDYIFIDLPPINVVTDAAVIGKNLDGIVVVTRVGKTDKKELDAALDQLNFANANVIGILLNGVEHERGSYTKGYKYGYSYGYGSRRSSSQNTSQNNQ